MTTLTLHVTKNEHSVLFHASQNGDGIQEFAAVWKKLKSLILNKSFEGRNAISIIQLIDDDYFTDQDYSKREIIEEDTKYLILSSTKWTSNTLNDMINYMEFDSSKQWFAERKAEENVLNTVKLVNDLQFTIETDTNLELFGCVNDGKEIVWLNPKLEYELKMSSKKKNHTHTSKVGSSSCIGIKSATKNYKMVLPSGGNNVVNIIDKTRGAVRNGHHVGEWVLRFDQAHRGAQYPHININDAISGVRDPHIQIGTAVENLRNIPPSPALQAAKNTAKALKTVNKVLLPVAVTIDCIRLITAIRKDIKKGKPKNTIKTAASIAGGWGGGYSGAVGGAAIGTAIFPGVGTIIGGILGGITGGVGCSIGAEVVASAIVDEDIPSSDDD